MKTTSKFGPFKDNKPFDDKVLDFLQSLLFWRGRRKGMIYTRDITWDDIRAVFFPENFNEKYKYLGSVPHKEDSSLFKALYPLVLAMDYEAKPEGCPRWFLRFLHLFGSDNSIVRVRNRTLHNLKVKLTKGILMNDYKTKWADYDLRISVSVPEHLYNLAHAIEREYFSLGRQKELVEQIKELDPNARIIWGDVNTLVKQYNNLKDKTNQDVYDYIS